MVAVCPLEGALREPAGLARRLRGAASVSWRATACELLPDWK